jgi:hypothetical protein
MKKALVLKFTRRTAIRRTSRHAIITLNSGLKLVKDISRLKRGIGFILNPRSAGR